MQPPTFVLRAPRASDTAAAIEVHCDPETNRFRPGGVPTQAEVEAYIPAWLAHWHEHGFGYWAVERGDGRVVGFGGIALRDVGRHFGLNLYFRLRPEAWGQGLSTLLGRAALREAFEVREFERVLGLVRPANLPSRRALERLGMTQIDTFDDAPGEAHSLIYEVRRGSNLISKTITE